MRDFGPWYVRAIVRAAWHIIRQQACRTFSCGLQFEGARLPRATRVLAGHAELGVALLVARPPCGAVGPRILALDVGLAYAAATPQHKHLTLRGLSATAAAGSRARFVPLRPVPALLTPPPQSHGHADKYALDTHTRQRC